MISMLFYFAIWLALTWTLNRQHLIVGGIVSIAAGLFFGPLFERSTLKIFQIHRWFWMMVYIPVFVWEMTKANIDVASRVLLGNLRPIRPGIVRVKTRLKSEMGKVFLANSITLTPGTLTIDIKDETLYIHWIYVKNTELETATRDIVVRFENYLIKIFD